MSDRLHDAYEYCRAVCRKRARNFYHGLKLSPQPQRSALFAIYAWMRMADDLVDSAESQPRRAVAAQLQQFRQHTDAALAQQPRGNELLWLALADVASRFALTPDHFHSMLQGQIDDLSINTYETYEQLHTYCYRVASSVGLICIDIWGYDDPAARDLAIQRGIAFQLTNILRDFAQDHDGGRVYLPREAFGQFGLDPASLRSWSDAQRCEAMVQAQVARARLLYEQSAGLDELIRIECRATPWAMTAIYRGLLERISAQPSRIALGPRVRLGGMQKWLIALRAKRLQLRAVKAGGDREGRSAAVAASSSGASRTSSFVPQKDAMRS